jgi:hypothetical protein
MKTHTITVTVNPGSIQVDPDELTMFKNDEVQWAGTNARKFSIQFETQSPFPSLQLAHDVATTRQPATQRGHFKYSIVSAEDPSLVLDPVIIVDEPPSETK